MATPNRCVRVSDELWNAAHERARAEQRTLSEVITALLAQYVADGQPAASR